MTTQQHEPQQHQPGSAGSTALVAYQHVDDPLKFMNELGTAIAKSRMFGCENVEQGQVLALACLCEQQNPIQVLRRHHIIDGSLSMRADAMLAELRMRGGKHRVVCRTPDKAEIEIEYDGEKYRESLTWDEAKQEPYPYMKDGKTLKKNWRTPRARRQMLWARVCSEAVRTLCPEIVAGVYTPEEVHDYNGDGAERVQQPVDVEQLLKQRAEQAEAAAQREAESASEGGTDGVVDAAFEVVETPVPEQQEQQQPPEGNSTPQQRDELRKLFGALNAPDEVVKAALERRGVTAFRYLTKEQADELIKALQEKLAGKSQLKDEPGSTVHDSGPVMQVTVDEIKSLLAEQPAIIQKVKDWLTANNVARIADLDQQTADKLLEALKIKTIEQFFNQHVLKLDDRQPQQSQLPEAGSDIPF